MSNNKFRMDINLNVLNHLGIKLYSNVPAVLSEVVANAWDADATAVTITILKDSIQISDDGIGMTEEDANNKYLIVGYQKRDNDESVTKLGRKVMGRKGIGKLSLFSIAKTVEVHSMKNRRKIGFILNSDDIEKAIKGKKSKDYHPKEIPQKKIIVKSRGTVIVLKDIKHRLTRTEEFLKVRIARRFSILGKNNFDVFVNKTKVSIKDRNYFNKLEGLWLTSDRNQIKKLCDQEKLKKTVSVDSALEDPNYRISGWIGTVKSSGDLKDDDSENLNKICVVVRGKIAQEDILMDFPETSLFAKYLIGEIEADFLDLDDKEDIATSNRQDIIKEDERYVLLKNKIRKMLSDIKKEWNDLREVESKEDALKNPALLKWFEQLGEDSKKVAVDMFKKISKLKTEDEDERRLLYQHGVYAFETLKRKELLGTLESLPEGSFEEFIKVFRSLDDLEASLYYKIIRELDDFIKKNALERAVQKFLYDHLWILDASWERAAGDAKLELQFKKEEKKFKLSASEAKARIDIKYTTAAGRHIIIELKRPGIRVSHHDLIKQIDKYRTTVKKVLKAKNRENEPIEVICLVGQSMFDKMDRDDRAVAEKGFVDRSARVLLYSELLDRTKDAYKTYLNANEKINDLQRLIASI